MLGVLLVYYSFFGARCALVEGALWALFLPHVLLNIRPLRRVLDLEPVPASSTSGCCRRCRTTEREALEAGTVWWDGELFTGGPDWNKLLSAKAPALYGGRAGVHRRALRRTLPDDRRLGHHAPARGPAARSLRLHQEEGLLGDDHPQEVRRPRVLRLRALHRRREDREPLEHRRLDRRRAELARAGRTPAALRHGGAEARTSCRGSRAARRSPASA